MDQIWSVFVNAQRLVLFNERLSLVTLHMLSAPIRVNSVENVQLGSILGKERHPNSYISIGPKHSSLNERTYPFGGSSSDGRSIRL